MYFTEWNPKDKDYEIKSKTIQEKDTYNYTTLREEKHMELKDNKLMINISNKLKELRKQLDEVNHEHEKYYLIISNNNNILDTISLSDYNLAKEKFESLEYSRLNLRHEIDGIEECRELVMDYLLKGENK